MFASARLRLKPTAELCRRLAISTRAGIEDRRIWQSEVDRTRGAQRAAVARVSEGVSRGESAPDALAATGSYFPLLFRQMVAVGDASGTLDRTYRRLAEHYEHLVAARRTLWAALAWPLIQLGIAVGTIGVVIWISSLLNLKDINGNPQDIFGFGLTGSRGLTIYIALVIFAAIAVLLMVEAMQRGMLWTRSLQRTALKLPGLGHALQTLAMARFTWALQLVLDTSMDLRKALPLALDATGHDTYRSLGPEIAQNISRGLTLTEALADSGKFPTDLIQAIEVGEQSGMLAETMQRQSEEYQRRAATAISVIARIVGLVVWVLIAVLLVVLIFRVFSGYLNLLNSVSSPNFKV